MYDFKQVLCLNLIILCLFYKTNPGFNACFKVLMGITYSIL